ncbi:tail assembly chaperone [Staphylococcus equorum]|uniref:tail assembly chaperone n=1 Tax=Staphylococcus equorum TaxID=246432 RepID=UPI00192D1BDE|nr:tail assembly chaperone [Staphylococcus equorum]
MKITLKNKEYELDLDIGFAIALDEKYSMKQSMGGYTEIEFGVGVASVFPKLTVADLRGIVDFFDAALQDVKTASYTKKDLQKAVSDKAKDLGGVQKLAHACIEELQTVGLYDHILNPQMNEENQNPEES